MSLQIKNLHVSVDDKKILKGIDLEIRPGQVLALMGPNGSGKSSLCQAIMGHPNYQITQGKLNFNNHDLKKLSIEKRSKLGIALSWQNSPTIKGVKFNNFLKKISQQDFNYDLGKKLLNRQMGLNFSGGEKKIAEIMQILSLKTKLVLLDEIDSGLDLENIKVISQLIKQELIKKKVSIIIVTHGGEILNWIKPDKTIVIVDGEIVCENKDYKEVLETIKKYGYEKCKRCSLSAS